MRTAELGARRADVAARSRAIATRRRGGRPSRKVLVGATLVGTFILIAVVGPLVAPADPSATSSAVLQGPSASHLLGTTQTGQDVLSELLVGTRATVLVGFGSGIAATILAVIAGVPSGYFGGVAGELLSAGSNLFLVLPAFPLIIVLTGYLKNAGSWSIVVIIGVVGWALGARVLRAQTLTLRRRDFVVAAQATGESSWRIILWEILPNELPLIAYNFFFMVMFAVLTQAGLAFLGLGNVTDWSWGSILYWAQNSEAFNLGAWWWYVPPGLCVTLLGTGLVLVNFGIDELANPRLRRRPAAG